MDTRGILTELEAQKDRLDKAITALNGSGGRGQRSPGAIRRSGIRRRRRPLSAAAKNRISAAMKKAWARRKKTAAKSA
jgi:hypothetical protein